MPDKWSSKLKDIDYGKSRVRVAKINRHPDRHEFSDLTVDLRLQGSFEECYLAGDNSLIVPTDTMKNTVYAIASSIDLDPVEPFALKLAEHFLTTHAHVTAATIHVTEHRWSRVDPHTFEQGQSLRLAEVEMTREGATVHAGIDKMVLLKTTKSAFEVSVPMSAVKGSLDGVNRERSSLLTGASSPRLIGPRGADVCVTTATFHTVSCPTATCLEM